MTQFQVGQMVLSPSNKEYRVTDVFNDNRPDPVRGQRYGIQRIRDGKPFGPFRNFYDNSGFRILENA
jgi:hypothetical protein